MTDVIRCRGISFPALILFFTVIFGASVHPQSNSTRHTYFIDCSARPGDGSSSHPWNSLPAAQAHVFEPGDQLALQRGTVCHGSFAPSGSGTEEAPIRLTAYGEGPRPQIDASSNDRQALLLQNQEYWQIDSLDLSGGNTFGIYMTGDRGILHHLYLKNLSVHDVYGGDLKHKDNGLVVIGPSKLGASFDDILVDGVDVAHTDQWAGILVGGGPFYIPPEKFINQHIVIRNSSARDVFGDGIILFHDALSSIETSVAWETGMQPTETTGTPNAIWTWTCTDCDVRDNEAFLTDSPGVDGGAYDIDWSNTRNTVERNFAHDTQGYCFAVFAAGYITSDSIVRDNLCVDNAQSPRLAAMQGAAYLSTWNGGTIRGLRIERNTFIWNPTVSSSATIVDVADTGGPPIVFTSNHIEASAPFLYRANDQFKPAGNSYQYTGSDHAQFTLGKLKNVSLADLQAAGLESGSKLTNLDPHKSPSKALKLEATVEFKLESDGLLAPEARAQLVVLRSLAQQYDSDRLEIVVHLHGEASSPEERIAEENALRDLDAPSIRFDRNDRSGAPIRLLGDDGQPLKEWSGFQNAASLGGAVRTLLGQPDYSHMKDDPHQEAR